MEGVEEKISPFKIVGLISAIGVVLSLFIGGTMWVSMNMANNTVAIASLNRVQDRHEQMIEKNTEIIHQHDRLLVVLETHADQIATLTTFMTKGDRFTAEDGSRQAARIASLEAWRETFNAFKLDVGIKLNRIEITLTTINNKLSRHDMEDVQ